MRIPVFFFSGTLFFFISLTGRAADVVPNEVQMPGTQPQEISNLESPGKCDNCHGGYNRSVEPAHNWSGSMMAQAGRDPLFWATLAIAEQDFDGAGDLCLRCHSTGGWLAGRSTPTDGSGLAAGDADGVECDYCHKLTNPDNSDLTLKGVMNEPFVANDGEGHGWYGSGMSSMWGGSDKLGPYDNAEARHQFIQSDFHRKPELCGTCHDVSNPVTGDLAHNHGTLPGSDPVVASGTPGSALEGKVAFNNAPYLYGIVERTFSEFLAGAVSGTLVKEFNTLPSELQGGALKAVYEASGGESAGYENPVADRYYSCQSCHMRPVTGTGANKRGVPVRDDLPLHDMTGGNYWMASAIQHLDSLGKLRLGGGLTAEQKLALDDAALRAIQQLQLAATLDVSDDELTINNHTGHKLITGYPEGRRMWLNVKWFGDGQNPETDTPLREDGEFGDLDVLIDGTPQTVRTILDLDDPNLHLFEAHMGMTAEWASQLVSLNRARYEDLVLEYNRETGAPLALLGELAALFTAEPDTIWPTFHFAINNAVHSDNRIPPYGMTVEKARQRNTTPIDPDGAPLYLDDSGNAYEHYAEIDLSPPTGAAFATIDLLYQPTSWEYVQFLYLANDGNNAFLADEGANILDAWLNTGMAEPVVMASTTWTANGTEPPTDCALLPPALLSATGGAKQVGLVWSASDSPDIASYNVYYDQSGKAQFIDSVPCDGDCLHFTDTGLNNGQEYCYKITAFDGTGCESGYSNILCATTEPGANSATAAADITDTGLLVRHKGKNAYSEFIDTDTFTPGEEIVIRVNVADSVGTPIGGASVDLLISGPVVTSLTTTTSDGSGLAEAAWQTEAPKRNGHGGSPVGSYTVSVTGLHSSTHDWDGVADTLTFQLQ